MTSEVRRLASEEWRFWKSVRLEALQIHPECFASSFENEVILSDKEFEDYLVRHDIFAVFDERVVVGIAGFYVSSGLKTRHKGYLFGLYVKKGFRRKGYASQLLARITEHAEQQVEQLHCSVVTKNVEATELYIRHGFTNYGIETKALKMGEHYFDEHLMVLNLPRAT